MEERIYFRSKISCPVGLAGCTVGFLVQLTTSTRRCSRRQGNDDDSDGHNDSNHRGGGDDSRCQYILRHRVCKTFPERVF